MSVISDEEVKNKFALIEKNIKRLKEIADEIDSLIELWQDTKCEHEKKQLWERITLTLDAVDKEYCETGETIGELRIKIQKQQQQLQQSRSMVATNGVLSSLGMCALLAVEVIPVVGTITTIASVVSYAFSIKLGMEIKRKLQEVGKNLEILSKYDRELEEVMDRIRSQQDWMEKESKLDFEL